MELAIVIWVAIATAIALMILFLVLDIMEENRVLAALERRNAAIKKARWDVIMQETDLRSALCEKEAIN